MDPGSIASINRRVSAAVTAVLARTPVTPNALTAAGLALGAAAGWSAASGTRGGLILCAILLHAAFILDNCDGELARLRNMRTAFGARFDLFADVAVDLALWTGLFAAVWRIEPSAFWAGTYCAAAAGSALNGCVVVLERRAGCSTSVHARKAAGEAPAPGAGRVLRAALDWMCHNGDAIFLVWIMALTAPPFVFLASGAVYINGLWICRVAANRRLLVPAAVWKLAWNGAATALGVALLAHAARGISWTELGDVLAHGGFGFLAVLLIYPAATAPHAIAHFCLFPPETRRRMSFRRFFSVYIAGDSLNKITPFVDVGGEPFKIVLACKRGLATLEESVAAAWVARIVYVVSEILMILAGTVVLSVYRPSVALTWLALAGCAMSGVLVGMLVLAQKRGLVRFIAGLTSRLQGLPRSDDAGLLRRTEEAIEDIRRARQGAFAWSIFWGTAGWVAGLAEVYAILRIAGVPVTLGDAFVIQAVLQAVQTVTFFIPGNLGSQESGLAILLTHMGFSATLGFAVSILKRVRQLAWAALGPLWYICHSRASRAAGRRWDGAASA